MLFSYNVITTLRYIAFQIVPLSEEKHPAQNCLATPLNVSTYVRLRELSTLGSNRNM